MCNYPTCFAICTLPSVQWHSNLQKTGSLCLNRQVNKSTVRFVCGTNGTKLRRQKLLAEDLIPPCTNLFKCVDYYFIQGQVLVRQVQYLSKSEEKYRQAPISRTLIFFLNIPNWCSDIFLIQCKGKSIFCACTCIRTVLTHLRVLNLFNSSLFMGDHFRGDHDVTGGR